MDSKLKFGLVIAGLLAAVSLAQGFRNAISPTGSQDFQWSGSRLLLQHEDPYAVQFEAFKRPKPDSPILMDQHPNYPPSGLVLLWPYATFPWPMARAMWAVSNFIFAGVIIMGLGRLFLQDKPWWWTFLLGCLFIMGTPFRNTIGNGQHALFSLAFLVIALHLLDRNRTFAAGVFLAISLFKYTVTIPFLAYFIMKRRWDTLLVVAGLHLILTLVLGVWVGKSPVSLLIDHLRVAGVVNEIGFADTRAVLRLLGLANHQQWWIALSSTMLVVTTVIIVRRGPRQPLLALTTLALVSVVAFYHLTYDNVVLVLPLFYLTSRERRGGVLLYGTLIGLLWYFEKIIFFLRSHTDNIQVLEGIQIYDWAVIIFFYATLFGALRTLIADSSDRRAVLGTKLEPV